MYTRDDLLKTYGDLKEKIETTEITDEVFTEIKTELNQLVANQHTVQDQIVALVADANDMCLLHKQIHASANVLYTALKRKRLEEQGVDLSKECNMYKYDLHLSHQICYGDFFKVELKKTLT
ncbi:MAG: hypothetical protein MR936_14955 [Eubacterium sp.]|nr:hypothetical protein [Eubacterium sp.]